jgi:hypothetical protein
MIVKHEDINTADRITENFDLLGPLSKTTSSSLSVIACYYCQQHCFFQPGTNFPELLDALFSCHPIDAIEGAILNTIQPNFSSTSTVLLYSLEKINSVQDT